MGYSIGQVADAAGVTVRTLRHYDDIGLLTPSARTATGYRRYDDADLDRLQQILFYRELGFPLEDIAKILDDPDADALTHLRRQRELLRGRIDRLRAMVDAIELAMEARRVGVNLTPEERFEVFGDFDPDRYEAEAEERWGGTDAYRESQRRVASYTKEDWKRIKAEQEAIIRGFVEAMAAGVPAADARAMDLAERHRQSITDGFYECTVEIHRGLADLYVSDPRFTAAYDRAAEGLAQYVHDAILANADRQEGR
ncbi:MerR family transcriptional regulator [Thermomonospora amylolytica]|uniref:MerR family transcriptional regulator n=1 Tax=Thermomonospora amylolytica TaxID=1411117 RepID=UPI000E6CEC40|nr:MerR family transcriptional regulator [Thermomonospora amylolytica]